MTMLTPTADSLPGALPFSVAAIPGLPDEAVLARLAGQLFRALPGSEASSPPSAPALNGLAIGEPGPALQPVAAPRIDGQVISDSFFAIAGFGLTQLARMMTPLLGRAPGPQELEPFTLELIDWFATLPEEVVPNAITALDAAGQSMRNFLAAYDVVLCPTMPIPPPALATLAPTLGRDRLVKETEQLAGYTPIYSIAGVPAMSVPLYVSDEDAPIGSHFGASLGQERVLLGLAYQLERASGWADRWPPSVST